MNLLICPTCGQPLPDADPVGALAAQFEELCRERGHWISIDGRVTEPVAAELLERAPGTLRNWRSYGGASVRHYFHHGRITYALRDIAEYVVAGRAAATAK